MKYVLSVLFVALTAGSAFAQLPVEVARDQQKLLQSKDPQVAANKKLVYDFWREVFQTHRMADAPKYMAPNYIQHNPNVPTGRQAFMDFFGKMKQEPVKPTIDNLVTIVGDHDLVTLAFRQSHPDPKKPGQTYTTTWFDMFRVQNGKIVEHWDPATK